MASLLASNNSSIPPILLTACTLSCSIILQVSAEDLIMVDKVKGASEFKRLNDADYEEWLEDYSLGELWKKNLLGVRPQ